MKIEILYFDGCPNHKPAVDRMREVFKDEGISAEISELNITNDAAARAAGFLGSPSIRINGLDVEPAARQSKEFGLTCRTYLEGGVLVGIPSRELIQAALREAAESESAHDCCRVPATTDQLSEPVSQNRKGLLLVSVTAAVGASLCCILPIVAAATGLGAIAAGAAFEQWRPYLLGVTGLLLGAGFLLAYRDYKKACAPGSLCATKPISRWNFVMLGAVAVLAGGLAAFPYYSGSVARVVLGQSALASKPIGSTAALATVTLRVPGMDCQACAVVLSASLTRLSGVADAKLDIDSRKAVVSYDPAAQNVAAIEKTIRDAGFEVSPEPGS